MGDMSRRAFMVMGTGAGLAATVQASAASRMNAGLN